MTDNQERLMKVNYFIEQKLIDNDMNSAFVGNTFYNEYFKLGGLGDIETFKRAVRRLRAKIEVEVDSIAINENMTDEKSLENLSKLASQRQKNMDLKNLSNKENRELYRRTNYLEELYKEFNELLKTTKFSNNNIVTKKVKKVKSKNKKYGILSLADIHFNSKVDPSKDMALGDNAYNFTISSQRLKMLKEKASEAFKSEGITDIMVLGLGDFVTSERLLTQRLGTVTNLSRACLLGIYILYQFLEDLSNDFNIIYTSICGNESRIADTKNFDTSDILTTENFDFLIHNSLRHIAISSKNKKINVIDPNDFREAFISYGGLNFIAIHGDTTGKDYEKTVRDFFSKYSLMGKCPNFIIMGHYHSTVVTPFYIRSGSLMGVENYSGKKLHFSGRASQNIIIINEDGSHDTRVIDLQSPDNEGYDIVEELERYKIDNEKSYNQQITIRNMV